MSSEAPLTKLAAGLHRYAAISVTSWGSIRRLIAGVGLVAEAPFSIR